MYTTLQRGFTMNFKFVFLIFFSILSSLTLYADVNVDLNNIATDSDDFTTWIALFGLGLIGLFALFLSSTQTKNIKQQYEEKEKKELETHKNQNEIISKIGENIYDIAKDKESLKSDSELLSVTTNLIDFLKIKSKKIKIENEKLKLSNLLNDVSGTLKSHIKERELELIYNISPNVAKNINADTLNLSKVLTNILIFAVEKNANFITLTIETNSLQSKDDQLFFTINTHLNKNVEEESHLFDAKYNDESESYESLALFISKELALLMHGDLIARNNDARELEFLFSIPYHKEESTQVNSAQENSRQNILIIDSSEHTAQHLQENLRRLGHKTKIISSKEYLFDIPIFQTYDIIFLEEKLFVDDVMMELQKIESQIVATYNIFEKAQEYENTKIADMKISKPLTIWQLSDVLHQLSIDKIDNNIKKEALYVSHGNAIVHRNSFQMTRNVTLAKFIQFKNKRVLLVEDNLINQKVFVGILGKSKMDIQVAANGVEALQLLEKDKNFDIIFMDINMPVMDGYTASRKIREHKTYDDIPIIALSALTSNDEIAKMFTSGMNAYISKPLKKEILFTVFLIFLENTTVPHSQEMENSDHKILKLDGLNIELGISKSAYNDVFYKEILMEFKDAYQNSDQVLRKLLTDFRYEQLRILCLDIKGLAGTIGAEEIHQTLSDIVKEITLKQYDTIEDLILRYESRLAQVNSSIDKYLKQ